MQQETVCPECYEDLALCNCKIEIKFGANLKELEAKVKLKSKKLSKSFKPNYH